MKKVLVIGGFKNYHKRLKNLGYKIDIIKNKNKISPEDANLYNKIIGLDDIDNYDKECNKLVNFIKNNKYDFIYNYSEKGQLLTAYLCQQTGYPYHSIDTVKAVNNKYIMRKKLQNTMLDNVKYKLIKSSQDLMRLKIDSPWILKPLDSWGSNNIKTLSKDNLYAYPKSLHYPLLAEEKIEGNEYSVEAFVKENDFLIISITKKYVDPLTFVELGHTVRIKLQKHLYNKLKKFLKILFSKLGIKNGVTHTEFKIQNDTIYLIETHIRMGGDKISDAISFSTNIDIDDLIVKESIDKNLPLFSPLDSRPVSIWFGIPKTNGVIDSIKFNGIKNKNILSEEFLIHAGEYQSKLHSSFERTAIVIATGNNDINSLYNARSRIAQLNISIRK